MTWIPTYLYEIEALSIGKIGLKIFLIPVFGVIGTLIYNKIKISRHILTGIYMVGFAIVFIIFPNVSGIMTTVLLLASGFLVYGPHVFFVSTMPSQVLDKNVVAASTGFINGMGYLGTTLIGILVPFILARYDWTYVFWFWSALSLGIIAVVAILYTTNGKQETA